MKTYKCGFQHCNCEEPLTEENGIPVGKRYWHKECYHIKETADKIRKYYVSHISSQVTMAFLNSVISDILYKKKVNADYLLFALKYAYETNKSIKSPAYLHYIADDKRIQKLYNTTMVDHTKKRTVSIDTEFDYSDHDEVPATKRHTFADILRKE